MYEYTDKVIKSLNRTYLRLFDRLKLLSIDELNIVGAVDDLYEKASKLAKKRYLDIAGHAYIAAMIAAKDAGYDVDVPTLDDVPLGEDWILDYLIEVDPVTLYIFDNEVERKKQRLIEALAATKQRNAEIDKALRYWVLQSSQYADNFTVEATIQAFKDAGVKYVKWVTERDERVCVDCHARDNVVYPIDDVPDKPHYHCRCWLSVSTENGNESIPDIVIGKSVGAKAKNDDVLDLKTGLRYNLAEGSRISNVHVFAGKGARKKYEIAEKYAARYGGDASEWQHVKGFGLVETIDGDRPAELHWSQCEGIGRVEMFIKRWLDED